MQHEVVLKENAYLKQTDYVAAKIAEGAATAEEYAETIGKRQAARDAINAAQAEIERLESIEIEEEEPMMREEE